jgi:peptide/nickel transport system substrate-binding protein
VRRLALLACLLAASACAVSAHGQSAPKPTVFDIGNTQDIDSMNPLVGVSVPSYEAWNLEYEQLVGKSAKDFSPVPGLATSWTASDDGKTWTYKLRPNMKWSDGQPLTSEDVAFTVNQSRKDEWLNYTAVTANLQAEAPDPNTVVIHSSVPDPKLPVMDVYILPKHVYGKLGKAEATKYKGEDGVGSGPFVLDERQKGQFARFNANPNYWRGKPKVDRVVLRNFNNPDAMVAALKRGEIDAIEDVPGTQYHQLEKDPDIQTLQGYQGAMNELALNGGAGLKKPHPALLDPRVREAISHAIDRQTIVDKVLAGLGKPSEVLSVSPDPAWTPAVPPEDQGTFDLDQAKKILDDAGYKDTNGDGIREMPGGGRPLNFRYAVRSEGNTGESTAEFISGWLKEIGIKTTQKVYDDSRLTELIGKGDYDMFVWGWTPFVDPEQMVSYFTCDQVASDPKDPTNYYNDANWCDKEYDSLYKQQKVETDRAKREDLIHQMLLRFHDANVYQVLYVYPDTQAYVKGRFTGFQRQPEKTGPVIYSNSSPTYATLAPMTAASGAGSADDGGGSGGLIAIIVAVVVVAGGVLFMVRRRRTAYERE